MNKSVYRKFIQHMTQIKNHRLKFTVNPFRPKIIKGDWIDEFGKYHPPRNWHKMTKHCSGWNNNNGR